MVAQLGQMITELKKCEAAGATTACLMQIYVYIDSLAYFGRPATKDKTTRSDFIAWVDKYLKADSRQSYQYRGKDVYGARCALLHNFSSETDYHSKYPDTIKFGYHNGGQHAYNPQINSTLAIIGIPSLINDFVISFTDFMEDIKIRISDEQERAILQARLDKILNTVPFPTSD